jgi:fucose 4-O-acetylase-like acetyltransferase
VANLTLGELAAATPLSRDRVVDFLRGFSILSVVVGHWMIGVVTWEGGVLQTVNAVGLVRGLWLLTWVFQVMPIFFFVGGFSNLTAYAASERRGEPTSTFVRGRLSRLLRPSLVFFAVWIAIVLLLHLTRTGAPTGPRLWGDVVLLRLFRPPGATLPFGPLWFLAVYLVVVSIAPWMVALHRRFRWWIPFGMAVGAVVADTVGFIGGVPLARWANVVFVLLLPHQLGFFYADGTFRRVSRRMWWAMVLGGLAGLAILTNPPLWTLFGDVRHAWFPGIGTYPKSLLGTDVELVSNAYPPTVCFLLGGLWTIGAAMLLHPLLTRWLAGERAWRATIAVNSVIMTLFLWHMTAFLLAVLTLWPLGLGRAEAGGARWWLERVAWVGVSSLYLGVLVGVFGRVEHRRSRPSNGS